MRGKLSASLRWSVFARDGFTCRYCGAQAGEDGVELAVDHVRSVAEGGDNSIDNLVAACQRCNGGKGARTLATAPAPGEVVERIKAKAARLQDLADAMAAAAEASKGAEQEAVNLKCQAYGVDSVRMAAGEVGRIMRLCAEHGADCVLDWYSSAAEHGVHDRETIRYVYGIIRRRREEFATTAEAAGGDESPAEKIKRLQASAGYLAFAAAWAAKYGGEYPFGVGCCNYQDRQELVQRVPDERWLEVYLDAETLDRYLSDPWWTQDRHPLWGLLAHVFRYAEPGEAAATSGAPPEGTA